MKYFLLIKTMSSYIWGTTKHIDKATLITETSSNDLSFTSVIASGIVELTSKVRIFFRKLNGKLQTRITRTKP